MQVRSLLDVLFSKNVPGFFSARDMMTLCKIVELVAQQLGLIDPRSSIRDWHVVAALRKISPTSKIHQLLLGEPFVFTYSLVQEPDFFDQEGRKKVEVVACTFAYLLGFYGPGFAVAAMSLSVDWWAIGIDMRGKNNPELHAAHLFNILVPDPKYPLAFSNAA